MLSLEESLKKELIIREYNSLNEEQKTEYLDFLVTTMVAMLGDLKELQAELGARIIGFDSIEDMEKYFNIKDFKEDFDE